MIILQAPLPALQTTTLLPDPRFSDVINRPLVLNRKFSMNGTKRTYVKKNNRRRLTFDFELTRMKALELRAFIESYFASKMRLTTHLDEVYDGYLANNPFELSGAARAEGWPGGESWSINLLFDGIPL